MLTSAHGYHRSRTRNKKFRHFGHETRVSIVSFWFDSCLHIRQQLPLQAGTQVGDANTNNRIYTSSPGVHNQHQVCKLQNQHQWYKIYRTKCSLRISRTNNKRCAESTPKVNTKEAESTTKVLNQTPRVQNQHHEVLNQHQRCRINTKGAESTPRVQNQHQGCRINTKGAESTPRVQNQHQGCRINTKSPRVLNQHPG